MSEVIIIAAISLDGIIGVEGRLPWYVPEDMEHFKNATTGYPVIMGRKTAEGFPNALSDRRNIVLSRSDYSREGFEAAESLGEALLNCVASDKIFIIGGGEVYANAMKYADRIEMTSIQKKIGRKKGAVYFPQIDPNKWEIVYSKGDKECTFYTYLPRRPKQPWE